MTNTSLTPHHVVIVGGGFGGLYTAKNLGYGPVKVTLIDKRNFHLFQPLLYQVATATLSPADICSPLRLVFSGNQNTQVLMDEVVDVEPAAKKIILKDGELNYDTLIVATGVSHHYFGNEQWQKDAPGLKTIEDALEIRRRVFFAFEAAEKETDPQKQEAWLTFVIVGGGPTGVELAGAIGEIANSGLKRDFRRIDTTKAKILLIESFERVLPTYPPELSANAEESLKKLGVTIFDKTKAINITPEQVTIKSGDQEQVINARTTLWAAGIKASKMGEVLREKTGVELDRAGRVIVEPDLSIPNHPDIFVIGDLALYKHQGEQPLPGIAPVAIQQGKYVAKLIEQKLKGNTLPPFRYFDAGKLAVIGQNYAVVDLHFLRLSGFPAWFVWVFAHIYYLVEFDNKLIVMIQWAWNYLTRGRGARLITGGNKNVV